MVLKRLMHVLIILLFISFGGSCESTDTPPDSDPDQNDPTPIHIPIEPIVDTFDFDVPDALVFHVDIDPTHFSHVQGLNITSADYVFEQGVLTIDRAFLAGLDVGAQSLTLYSIEHTQPFTIHIANKNNRYRIINGGFETGNLFGWTALTVFKDERAIQAFISEGVKENTTFFSFDAPYGGDGDYVYGFDDRDGINKDRWNERIGRLTSSPFELGGSGWISFMLGGGRNTDLLFVSVRRLEDDVEIARYGHTMFNQVGYFLSDGVTVNPEYREANLVRYHADLSDHLGEWLYVDIQDLGGRDWDLFTLDSFEMYHGEAPVLNDVLIAIDLRPSIVDADQPPMQMRNQDFSLGLEHWLISGDHRTFHVENGALKTNLEGDGSSGLIRSPAFRLDPDGSGFISFELAAGQGARFDKDTFISVREVHTNKEVFRTANTRSEGTAFIEYFVDLRAYKGQALYLEIIDNATGAWDTLFIQKIETHHLEEPVILPLQMAKNLME